MNGKICSKCKEKESLSYHCYCKDCHNTRQKEYYKTHPQSTNKSAKKRKAVLVEISRKGRDKPCADCGERYPFYVMDYDHVRGKKLFNISTAGACKISVKKLQEEIAKCDVVCSNCHRERTWGGDQENCQI